MPTARRHSVLVLLCDQLRPDFLSVYGGDAVPTPNLDRLADRGVVFDHAITQSTVCAPARASMMTGRYVSDHGVWTNDVPFRDGVEYLPERLNELGYATAAFGKLHHFPADDAKGFKHVRQMEEGRLGDDEPYLAWLKGRHPEVTRMWNAQDGHFAFGEDEYYEHWIASEAIRFIETHHTASPDQPFLAWVAFQGPHGPFDPPIELRGTCREERLPKPLTRNVDPETPEPETVQYRRAREPGPTDIEHIMRLRGAYAEMIVAIDNQIGRLLDTLEQTGTLDQTTIIFSADHGDMLWDYGITAKGPFPYRGQLDIPMIVANHHALTPGTRSVSLVGNIDIPGTILDIAGAKRGIGMSRSLLELGREYPVNPRTVNYSEFCDSVRTVEDHRYRYSYYPFEGVAELYDHSEDPDEQRNLAGKEEAASVERRFLQHLLDFAVMSHGFRVEAHDFVPTKQEGARHKAPHYQDDFDVVFPLNAREVDRLREAGLDTDFNEFCRRKDVLHSYSPPYWEA
ncbi:MAG: sulfatase-like hydrolase/transferase [Lentisphaerae bacterium]|jgi:arylsulfatase|nr:sulfatase-like hydrolase/transferase [Lentisphaerota bacterium]MBT4819675.1 sulfatase-like hydrolase/transferase [Lentisphaerota bacterium]MBT5608041.1 sulfatase-like hydrolase/transferase [Lentisphaerota bacterium]MBT7056491.1 sulfatase-like hydrolase/transferase [Lentisphaerota bacterium]MBT7840722.1 sulfatase-like hydrolase/transferase [Lentisphaerota bacterium]